MDKYIQNLVDNLLEVLFQSAGLIIVVLFIAGLSSLFGFNWGITHAGNVDIKDCRADVQLTEGDWETYWHKFYCNSWGGCYAVSTTNGACNTSYYYFKQQNSN